MKTVRPTLTHARFLTFNKSNNREEQETMKTVHLASTPGKSSTTAAMEDDRSESRDSCYYPGCRKDANCNCQICLASINATLDLMPISAQKSSFTKLSASGPNDVECTPISFNCSILSTPRSSANQVRAPPVLEANKRFNLNEKMGGRRERERGLTGSFMRLILGLNLICIAEFGLSRGISGVLRPVLSPGIVKNLGERSWVAQDLKGKLRFVQRELQSLVDVEVSNCSNANSVWKIDQDGLLLNSRCTLYKSAVEEVSIWGWPLQTAGLLTTDFSSRSFTVVSGRVTEWTDGKVGYLIRKANTSWVHRKWGASVVQLNTDTWVLEYRRSSVLDDPRLSSAVVEFLKYRISKMVGSMKQEFWLFGHAVGSNHFSQFTAKYDAKIPT